MASSPEGAGFDFLLLPFILGCFPLYFCSMYICATLSTNHSFRYYYIPGGHGVSLAHILEEDGELGWIVLSCAWV